MQQVGIHPVAFLAGEQAVAGHVREVAANHAGLHVAVHLPEGSDEVDVRRRALEAGVGLGDYRDYWADPAAAEPGLMIGFGAIDTADLPLALSALGDVLARGRSSTARSRPMG